MPDSNKTIGFRIGMARDQAGETQADLAAALGVKREMVTYWENGTRPIKAETIIAISNRYNVSADFLLGLSQTAEAKYFLFSEQTGFTNETINTLLHLSAEGSPSIQAERMRVSLELLLNCEEAEKILSLLQQYLDIVTESKLSADVPFDVDYYVKKDSEVSEESGSKFHVVASDLYAKTFQTMACSELTKAFETIAESSGVKWSKYLPREKTIDEARQDMDKIYEWRARKSKIHERLWNELVNREDPNNGKRG